MGGFVGRILKVNLTNGNIKEERLEESFYRKWFGCTGFVSLIYQEMESRTDPLGPGNILGLTTGVLTGTPTPFSGSFTAVGKSPLTGTWGEARGGGFFGPELKRAGYDAVFFYGKSDRPVYLMIKDDDIRIVDADESWGKLTSETETMIRESQGDKAIQVACIGPAGEKRSRISAIINDGRAAARSGLGAVMGSKNLKAVAVRGRGTIPIKDLDKARELRKNFVEKFKKPPMFKTVAKYGTTAAIPGSILMGDSPVKNWGGEPKDFTNPNSISGEALLKYVQRDYGCWGCDLRCGAIVKVPSGPYAVQTHRPEYETLAAFGSMCLDDNLESIIYANWICNEYGLDTISAGGVVAFAIECYENGLITSKDTDGLELKWGDAEAIVELTKKIAKREGFGDVLAEGVKMAAERIGRGSEAYAMHICGQEVPMHDPRLIKSPFTRRLGLVYTVDATPARHTVTLGGYANVALGVCMFLGAYGGLAGGYQNLYDFLAAVAGWNVTAEEMKVVSDRIATMRQAFNVREGFKPSDFRLPDRILGKPPLASGPNAGVTLNPEPEARDYFAKMGWDYETGKPSREKLTELGLEEVIKDFY